MVGKYLHKERLWRSSESHFGSNHSRRIDIMIGFFFIYHDKSDTIMRLTSNKPELTGGLIKSNNAQNSMQWILIGTDARTPTYDDSGLGRSGKVNSSFFDFMQCCDFLVEAALGEGLVYYLKCIFSDYRIKSNSTQRKN